jgi:hypothetical protein
MDSITNSILVGYDYNPAKDNAVLIVGKQVGNKSIQIINAFQGDEATALWNKLVEEKGE